MTVRLLCDWTDSRDGKRYKSSNLLTTDAGTEAGLVAAKLADINLTGGTTYIPPAVAKQTIPVMAEVNPLTGGLGFSLPDGGYLPASKMRTACLLGDSIAAQNLTGVPQSAGTGVSYPGGSWLAWAQARLGWLWDVQYPDNFAVGGVNCSVMRNTQLPLALAAHRTRQYDRAFISGGTNDLFGSRTLQQTIDDLQYVFIALANNGIIPVYIGVLPRNRTGGVLPGHKKAAALNAWAAMFAATTGLVEYIPCHECVADNSTADGYILAAASSDNLHPGDWGAYQIGEQLYSYYKNSGLRSILRFAESPLDNYDATDNRRGVCFELPNAYLLGGPQYPTHMSVAGANCTWATGTRPLDNGQTKPVVNCTITGATSGFLYDDSTASAAWLASDTIAEGDVIYAQAQVAVTTGGAGILPSLFLNENNGANSCSAGCLLRGNADIPAMPDGTILTLRTPNITVRPYGGSGSAAVFAHLRTYSSGAAGVLQIRSFEMRKAI